MSYSALHTLQHPASLVCQPEPAKYDIIVCIQDIKPSWQRLGIVVCLLMQQVANCQQDPSSQAQSQLLPLALSVSPAFPEIAGSSIVIFIIIIIVLPLHQPSWEDSTHHSDSLQTTKAFICQFQNAYIGLSDMMYKLCGDYSLIKHRIYTLVDVFTVS